MLETTQVSIQQNVAPLQGGVFVANCPWDATITSITLHFPAGCNALVDVAVGHSNIHICPHEGFIALDDATPVIPVHETVRAGEQLFAEIRNGDAINPHAISVIMTLERK
jgi:hypothetical protein